MSHELWFIFLHSKKFSVSTGIQRMRETGESTHEDLHRTGKYTGETRVLENNNSKSTPCNSFDT